MKFRFSFCFVLLSWLISAQSVDQDLYSIGERVSLYSKILQEDREVIIHKPSGFWGMDEELEKYAIIFVLDGESQFLNTVAAVDYLSGAPMGNDKMPRSIVVGIPNTNRSRDLTPYSGMMGIDSSSLANTGGGAAFLDFITTELIPYIDSSYAASNHRTIIGHSLGGLLVYQALLEKRKFFNNYLAIDPALFFDNESYLHQVIDSLESADLHGKHLFMSTAHSIPPIVNIENITDDNSEIVKLTKSNMKFVKMMNTKKSNIDYSIKDYPDEDHFSVPFRSTYDAMKFFYSYYPFREIMDYYHPTQSHRTDLITRLHQHYKNISSQLGYNVKPMVSYINSWAYGLAHFQRSTLALELFDYGIMLYPDQTAALHNKAYYLENNGGIKEAIELFEKSLLIEYDEDIAQHLQTLKEQ